MNSSRQSNRSHWVGVGRRAQKMGVALASVLCANESVNAWVREGYYSLTTAQLHALRMIAEKQEDDAFSEGIIALHRLPGRMVNAYRVAGSLIDKGLATRSGDHGHYLRITDAGRDALSAAEHSRTAA